MTLSVVKHSFPPTQNKNMTTCAICLEELDPLATHTLDCTHSFHSSCLLSAVLRGHKHCPICRVPFITDDDSEEEEQEYEQMETERWQQMLELRAQRRLVREQAIRKGLRQAREHKATAAVTEAVRLYKEATVRRADALREEKAARSDAHRIVKDCRAAIAPLLNAASPLVREMVRVHIGVSAYCHTAYVARDKCRVTRHQIGDAVLDGTFPTPSPLVTSFVRARWHRRR